MALMLDLVNKSFLSIGKNINYSRVVFRLHYSTGYIIVAKGWKTNEGLQRERKKKARVVQ